MWGLIDRFLFLFDQPRGWRERGRERMRAVVRETDDEVMGLLETLVSGHDGHPSPVACSECNRARERARVYIARRQEARAWRPAEGQPR